MRNARYRSPATLELAERLLDGVGRPGPPLTTVVVWPSSRPRSQVASVGGTIEQMNLPTMSLDALERVVRGAAAETMSFIGEGLPLVVVDLDAASDPIGALHTGVPPIVVGDGKGRPVGAPRGLVV